MASEYCDSRIFRNEPHIHHNIELSRKQLARHFYNCSFKSRCAPQWHLINVSNVRLMTPKLMAVEDKVQNRSYREH